MGSTKHLLPEQRRLRVNRIKDQLISLKEELTQLQVDCTPHHFERIGSRVFCGSCTLEESYNELVHRGVDLPTIRRPSKEKHGISN